MTSPLPASLALALAAAPLLARQHPAADPPGALPYEAAFDRRELLLSPSLAVTRDGNQVAYEVRQPPAGADLNARFLPNGTPSLVAGSKVLITDRAAARTFDACPGGSCWRPVWSPDGNALAFYSDLGGPPQLWVYDLAARKARKLSDLPVKSKLWPGDEPVWSPDGRTIYVPLAPEGEYRSPVNPAGAPAKAPPAPDDPRVKVLWSGSEAKAAPPEQTAAAEPIISHFMRENLVSVGAVELASGRVRVLAPASGEPKPMVLRISATGRWVSFLSVFKPEGPTSQKTTMDLAVVKAAGGPVRVVAKDLPQLNDYHRLNYSWHPSEDRLVYLKDAALWSVELGPDGPAAPRRLGAGLGDLSPTLNWFTRDGRAVVVGIDPFDDKDYSDIRPRGIAVVPLDGGAPRRFAIDDARWVYRDIVKADERTVWQPDGASITLLLEERATGERAAVRFDPATGAATVLWKGLARLESLTGGGSHSALIGIYQDLHTPPDLYRLPPDFSGRERVSHIDPRLDGVATGTAEVIETMVPLHDGTLGRTRTAVLLPAGAKRGDKLPAIVMMYPGSNVSREASRFGGGDAITVPNLVFTSRGYAVVLAGLPLGPNGQAGNPMQEMVDVLLPQLYRLAELGYVDGERLAVSGQSFGGYATAAIVSRTNLFRAAVAISGIYDLPGIYGELDDMGGSFWIGWSEGGQARMGTHPWGNLKRYVDNSPYYQADKIFTPLLIVHGDKDMSYRDAEKLFSALRRLDRPAEFASYGGEGHVIYEWKRAAAADAARRMVEFYRRHLGDPMAGRRAVP